MSATRRLLRFFFAQAFAGISLSTSVRTGLAPRRPLWSISVTLAVASQPSDKLPGPIRISPGRACRGGQMLDRRRVKCGIHGVNIARIKSLTRRNVDDVLTQHTERANRILRAQRAAKGLNFKALSQKRAKICRQEMASNLSSKIGRVRFMAGSFMICMEAMSFEIVRFQNV